jgi:hypothetical protein
VPDHPSQQTRSTVTARITAAVAGYRRMTIDGRG